MVESINLLTGAYKIGPEDVNTDLLRPLVGKRVSVFSSVSERRDTFATAISVSGVLDMHRTNGQMRIVISDGTYVYFACADIISVTSNPSKFQDGSICVIKIKAD